MTKSLHNTVHSKLFWKGSEFSAEMQRHKVKAQKWRAVADCSRHEQRRSGRLDHRRRWRVEFSGQSVMKTRPVINGKLKVNKTYDMIKHDDVMCSKQLTGGRLSLSHRTTTENYQKRTENKPVSRLSFKWLDYQI